VRSLFAPCLTAVWFVLLTAAPVSATTYPAITISVPVTISLPLTASQYTTWGSTQINVACVPSTSGARYFGLVPTSYNNGLLAYSGPNVQVQVATGLQSGAVVTCTVIVSGGPAALAIFNSLNVDMTKSATQIVLP